MKRNYVHVQYTMGLAVYNTKEIPEAPIEIEDIYYYDA